MSCKKNEIHAMSMQVTEGLTVTILPDSNHDFLMGTKEVAKGYGSTEYAIRQNKSTNPEDFIEGKHFVKGVSISHTQPHQIFWTKRGVVRLGFFIKSERAKLFRDWAEELIIQVDQVQRDLFHQPVKQKMLSGRNHNRLSPDRLIDILADVALIEQKDLRERLVNKLILKGGRV
jgi:hypothetical protein